MENRNELNDDQLIEVNGGNGGDIPPQHINVGDKVLLRIYPEYGVGIVREVKLVSGSWQCTVQFNAGMMTADEFEFIPAY